MLTTRESMTKLYLEGGALSVEAGEWLRADECDDTLDLIELAVGCYAEGNLDADETVTLIAKLIGYPLAAGGDA